LNLRDRLRVVWAVDHGRAVRDRNLRAAAAAFALASVDRTKHRSRRLALLTVFDQPLLVIVILIFVVGYTWVGISSLAARAVVVVAVVATAAVSASHRQRRLLRNHHKAAH